MSSWKTFVFTSWRNNIQATKQQKADNLRVFPCFFVHECRWETLFLAVKKKTKLWIQKKHVFRCRWHQLMHDLDILSKTVNLQTFDRDEPFVKDEGVLPKAASTVAVHSSPSTLKGLMFFSVNILLNFEHHVLWTQNICLHF